MKEWLLNYESLVKTRLSLHVIGKETDLRFWQDRLFLNFLVYCLPISLIAVIPGVIMALKDGYVFIALIDILGLLSLFLVTFSVKIGFIKRKICVIGIFYFFGVFLINTLGYIGPGIFYLFAITVLIALILPIAFAYWSVLINFLILGIFALIIQFKLFNSALIQEYSTGAWVAFSSNLIFLSIVIVALIHRSIENLQVTIIKKDQLQERYKSIFDKSPLPMWLFDTDSLKFLDVNESAERNYGYPKEEFLSMTIKDIRPAEKVLAIENLVKINTAIGSFYEGHSQHLKKNGEQIHVKIESNLLYFDGYLARLVLATDITAQLKNELEVYTANQKTKESESNLKAIFESATDGFVLLDTDFSIKVFNKKAREYFKFNTTQKEFEIGRNIFDFVEPSRHPSFKLIIDKVYAGQTVQYDRKHHSPTQPTYWIHYTIAPVYESNIISGACITGRDITADKTYLNTIENQNKTFHQISWMQSHLVRAPLARIIGLVTLLNTDPGKEEVAEILNFLSISAQELDEVIIKIIEITAYLVSKD